MPASRALLVLLLIFYFIIPVPVSEIIFKNDFYIYSKLQDKANTLSLLYGAIFIFWVCLLFRQKKPSLNCLASTRLVSWMGLRVAYFAMLVYALMVFFYGQKLRVMGASRADLLDGMDNFLFPGMGLLLMLASVFCVAKASRLQFYSIFLTFLLVDMTYNGKIFSFLAMILFFLRLDYINPSRKTILKAFGLWGALGVLILFFSGLMRMTLAGDDLNSDVVGVAYLFGSEFLGVQASIGWAMEYFLQSYTTTFWAFGSTLQDFYISSVGHGLATSPAAFFEANFGSAGPFVAIFGCCMALIFFRISERVLGWVAYLIVAINFQHFLRHGIDVFLGKVIFQMIFAIVIAALATGHFKRSVPGPHRQISLGAK